MAVLACRLVLDVVVDRMVGRMVMAAIGRRVTRLMLRLVFVACHALAGARRTAQCVSLADCISVEPLVPTRRKWQLRH